jgi:hypothetical protein
MNKMSFTVWCNEVNSDLGCGYEFYHFSVEEMKDLYDEGLTPFEVADHIQTVGSMDGLLE